VFSSSVVLPSTAYFFLPSFPLKFSQIQLFLHKGFLSTSPMTEDLVDFVIFVMQNTCKYRCANPLQTFMMCLNKNILMGCVTPEQPCGGGPFFVPLFVPIKNDVVRY
jgi:hypothetical protein